MPLYCFQKPTVKDIQTQIKSFYFSKVTIKFYLIISLALQTCCVIHKVISLFYTVCTLFQQQFSRTPLDFPDSIYMTVQTILFFDTSILHFSIIFSSRFSCERFFFMSLNLQISGTFQDLPKNSLVLEDFPVLEMPQKKSRTFKDFKDPVVTNPIIQGPCRYEPC